VENVGDLDGNGVNDLAVGAFDDNGEGTDRGAVHIIFLNSDGTLTKQSVEINDSTANGPTLSDTDKFGTSVADIGDLDGNGVNDLAVGAYLDNGVGSNRGTLHIIFMHKTTTPIEEEEVKKGSSGCYDCEAPKLTKVEVHITSQNPETQRISKSSEIWNFEQDSPLPMFGDTITPIVADPGDEVEIILELTDNRTLERVYDSGTYTNFLTKPNDMNTFYANNFDEYGKVSTTYYEWHQTGEDLVYDYSNTVQWSEPDITIQESGEFVKGGTAENLDGLVGTFTISFKMKFLEPMNTSDVWVQATDRSGNFFKVALPLTLKITGNEPLLFDSKVNQKVLSFFDESMLFELVSDWNGSSKDVSELTAVLGIPDEQLPSWVTNLAMWVSEDKITLVDMIVSIEHLINN
ncbi:MAG: integrin alpha, partial [Nitrosopumilus sp.]